jgi:Fic family protein
MKLPAIPPQFTELFTRESKKETFLDFLLKFPQVTDTEYLHWDELRRHQPPPDWTLESWWLALKMKRNSLYRELPFLDQKGQPFRFAIPDAVLSRLHECDFIGGTSAGAVSDQAARDRYIFDSLLEESITSSMLEGAATTRAVAKELIRTARSPRDKSERMILNNFEAMKRIAEAREKQLSPEFVFEIHRILVEGTLDNPEAAGRLRNSDEPVHVVDGEGSVFHEPPPANELKERLAALCQFANAEQGGKAGFIPPAIRAIILHFVLAYDHPFVDGNGRTARALFYWMMLQHGFSQFEYISISGILHKAPAQYARSFLHTETDDNDLTYFILHQLDVINRAIGELRSYAKRKQEELQRMEVRLRSFPDLNYRQISMISHAVRHPGEETSLREYQFRFKVAYATARADLLDIVERGLFEQRKRGKTGCFMPVPDLEQRLRST